MRSDSYIHLLLLLMMLTASGSSLATPMAVMKSWQSFGMASGTLIGMLAERDGLSDLAICRLATCF